MIKLYKTADYSSCVLSFHNLVAIIVFAWWQSVSWCRCQVWVWRFMYVQCVCVYVCRYVYVYVCTYMYTCVYIHYMHFRWISSLLSLFFFKQFCVHSDKKKMLQELTHDIHQSPNKQKVLLELANCIASGDHVLFFL